jgi:replicative DNA helicase
MNTEETNPLFVPFDRLVERSMAELDATDPTECISTSFDWLDDKIVGLFKGELLVVGGETGTGKTTFVTNICYKAAQRGIKVDMFALEDRLADYGIKAVYFELGRVRKQKGYPHNYPWKEYRKNEIKDPNYKSLRQEAESKIKNSNLCFADIPGQMNIERLEAMITERVNEGTKLFLIDHLHYFDMMRSDVSRAEYVEHLMIRIKSLQNKTGARIILVVHYKKLEGKKPMLDSFKDSVSIPQNANYVINMWRDRSETGNRFETVFYIPKARNPNGEATIKIKYDPDENEYHDEVVEFGTPQDNDAKEIAAQIKFDD